MLGLAAVQLGFKHNWQSKGAYAVVELEPLLLDYTALYFTFSYRLVSA